jgi:hypothetical protein
VTDQVKETIFGMIERWGFPTLVAIACGYIMRQDVLLPLVEEHRSFVKSLSETQREISKAVTEQTKLLYAMQPKDGEK